MSTSVTVSEARSALPEIIERVLAGDEVTLTRHGIAVAVVVSPDALRVRRADQALIAAASVNELLEQGRRSGLRSRPTMSGERAEALLVDLRAARSRG